MLPSVLLNAVLVLLGKCSKISVEREKNNICTANGLGKHAFLCNDQLMVGTQY